MSTAKITANQAFTPYEQLKFNPKQPPKWGTQLQCATTEQINKDADRYFSKDPAKRDAVKALTEPLQVDGYAQKAFGSMYGTPYGATVPGTDVKPPAPKRASGRGKQKYEPLLLSKNWALFDPIKGFPTEWPNIPQHLHRYTHYKPGDTRILMVSLAKNASVALCTTPELLMGKAIDYTPFGPKLVDAPSREPDEGAVNTLLAAAASPEPAAPVKGRKGKRKAAEITSEPLPAITESEEPAAPAQGRKGKRKAAVLASDDDLPPFKPGDAERIASSKKRKGSPSSAPTKTTTTTAPEPKPAAPAEGRRGKRKAVEMASEPLPATPEEPSENVLPSVESADAETAARVIKKRKVSPSLAPSGTTTTTVSEQQLELPQRSESVIAAEIPASKKRERDAETAAPAKKRKASQSSAPTKTTTVTPGPEQQPELHQRSESVVTAEVPASKKRKRQPTPLPEKRGMPARAGRGQRKNVDMLSVKAETPVVEIKPEAPAATKKKVRVMRKDSAVAGAGGETTEKKRMRKPSKPKITPALVVSDSE